MTKEMIIDKRIKEILKWGSMAAALYFSVAIDVLKQVIAQKNDREGMVGTMYATKEKGVRYLEMAEGYVTGIALDENNEVIGYQFVSLGKMTDFIKKGDDPNTAWEKAKGQYGRVADAVKIIDPREE